MRLNLLDPRLIVGVMVIALITLLGFTLYMRERRKTTVRLRERFGSEYDRAVREHGSERMAEEKLADREMRVEALMIRDLEHLVRPLIFINTHGYPNIFPRALETQINSVSLNTFVSHLPSTFARSTL
jgi:hypothetical protein